MAIRHIDLFSGIGGFALAAREVWGDDYHNVFFCEMNKYCQAVLRKNFGKDVKIYDDIRTVTADAYRSGYVHGRVEVEPAKRHDKAFGESVASIESSSVRIDLLTGGFPCQPFSQAGQRRGTEDDRYLWPEMLRVIKEFRPTWVIGENVAGILSMAQYESGAEMGSETDLFGNTVKSGSKSGQGILYGIIGDLEQIGYSVQTFVIPACAVNAPHRRDRVWIVANSRCEHGERAKNTGESTRQICGEKDAIMSERPVGNARNTTSDGCSRRGQGIEVEEGLQQRPEPAGELAGGFEGSYCDDTDTTNGRCEEYRTQSEQERNSCKQSLWDENWLSVATRTCVRGMDDGLPVELDGLKLSKSGHRVERLKALGNAIVPQVAIEIMQAIKQAEEENGTRAETD
ncbi:MAG TPA: DNA (cytosine-5-)-methyltransferase [Spirochaetota bacterium]|nr:DNA (cytosine-5-)-methyltransferase [Spirochaetota bacterium]